MAIVIARDLRRVARPDREPRDDCMKPALKYRADDWASSVTPPVRPRRQGDQVDGSVAACVMSHATARPGRQSIPPGPLPPRGSRVLCRGSPGGIRRPIGSFLHKQHAICAHTNFFICSAGQGNMIKIALYKPE